MQQEIISIKLPLVIGCMTINNIFIGQKFADIAALFRQDGINLRMTDGIYAGKHSFCVIYKSKKPNAIEQAKLIIEYGEKYLLMRYFSNNKDLFDEFKKQILKELKIKQHIWHVFRELDTLSKTASNSKDNKFIKL